MPDVIGRLHPPRLAAAPASPAKGELYFDTGTSKLYWWNGTIWVDSTGSGTPTAARMYANAGVAPAQYTWVKVPLAAVAFDDGAHTNTTGRYTCPNTGYYAVSAQVVFNAALATQCILGVFKNGVAGTSNQTKTIQNTGSPGALTLALTDIVKCNANDYLEMAVYPYDNATVVAGSGPPATFLSVFQI